MQDIIFWFDNPPGISRGVFNEVSNLWEGKCFYIAVKDTRPERKAINWDAGGYGKAELIILEKEQEPTEFIEDFLHKHLQDIHIFTGYKGLPRKFMDQLIRMKSKDVYIWAEGPVTYGLKRKIVVNILHRYYALRYRDTIKAMLPLGKNGVKVYRSIGWYENKLFPFLYLPLPRAEIRKDRRVCHDKVRFIYVGRFSKTKGLKILMDACDFLADDKWSLDLVGGYGELSDQVQEWISKKDNVNFLGKWNINDVEYNMQDYDVCIVPSAFDGWNVTVNKAINAHIGVITTDAAGSNDMIEASGAGMVVSAGNAKELASAMNTAINDHAMVEEWKRKAGEYISSWNGKDCAKYFIDILLYAKGELNNRPEAPWL